MESDLFWPNVGSSISQAAMTAGTAKCFWSGLVVQLMIQGKPTAVVRNPISQAAMTAGTAKCFWSELVAQLMIQGKPIAMVWSMISHAAKSSVRCPKRRSRRRQRTLKPCWEQLLNGDVCFDADDEPGQSDCFLQQ